MNDSALFSPYSFAGVSVKNRFVLAPMTRCRTTQPGDIPNAMMAQYYNQRTTAGLLISEATQISLQGKGYAGTPGIYAPEQIEGWRLVTDSVHQKNGKIFLQLWHVGRVSSAQVNGLVPLAPSALKANDTSVCVFAEPSGGPVRFIPVDTPREMMQKDIDQVINEFVQGAKNAIKAGFDGVEVHGANGYLIDQFLRSNSNKRTDRYGGSKENRTRFLEEVTSAVVAAVGKEKTGVRLSPFIKFKDMDDPEILETSMIAAEKCNKMGLAYLHLCEADWDDAPQVPESFRSDLRQCFKKAIIATGNKTPEQGNMLIEKGWADMIGFGRKFLSNPDYPQRVRHGSPLNEIVDGTNTIFGGYKEGYTDYPAMQNT